MYMRGSFSGGIREGIEEARGESGDYEEEEEEEEEKG